MSKTAPVTTKQHIRSSFRDSLYTSLNVGMTESYFCAFMLALGISEVISGFGTVVPQFIGAFFLLLSIKPFFRKFSLRKRLLFLLGLQAMTMLPLIVIGILKINSATFIISVLGLYWACVLSLNPPWNSLIGYTIPLRFRLKFFSIRAQFGQAAVFIGLIISGLILHNSKNSYGELPIYVGIFAFGFILKGLSWWEIKKNHKDHQLSPQSDKGLTVFDFFKGLKGTDQGRLVIFLFFFYFSVYLASPYFAPYMLRKLQFNYLEFMAIAAISYFGRIFTLKVLQKRARPKHVNFIFTLAVVGIATSPLLWAFSTYYWWIMAIEFLSGCYWGSFELSTVMLYYEKINDRERTTVMAYITFINTMGMVFGCLTGALFMRFIPITWSPYIALFITSTIMRGGLLVFAPQMKVKENIPKLIGLNRMFGVQSPFGILARPFRGKMKKNSDK